MNEKHDFILLFMVNVVYTYIWLHYTCYDIHRQEISLILEELLDTHSLFMRRNIGE